MVTFVASAFALSGAAFLGVLALERLVRLLSAVARSARALRKPTLVECSDGEWRTVAAALEFEKSLWRPEVESPAWSAMTRQRA